MLHHIKYDNYLYGSSIRLNNYWKLRTTWNCLVVAQNISCFLNVYEFKNQLKIMIEKYEFHLVGMYLYSV